MLLIDNMNHDYLYEILRINNEFHCHTDYQQHLDPLPVLQTPLLNQQVSYSLNFAIFTSKPTREFIKYSRITRSFTNKRCYVQFVHCKASLPEVRASVGGGGEDTREMSVCF